MELKMKYEWFKNKNDFAGINTGGIKLDLNTLKLLLLDEQQQFKIKIKNNIFKIKYLAKCKIEGSNKWAQFAISIKNTQLFVIRIDDKHEYAPEKIYSKSDFLSLCTMINRKLKFE